MKTLREGRVIVGVVEKPNGKCPVEKLIAKFSAPEKRAFRYIVERIAKGEPLPKSKYKKLRPHELWQIRVEDYRFFVLLRRHNGKQLSLITHGTVKKAKKLDIAKQLRQARSLANADSW